MPGTGPCDSLRSGTAALWPGAASYERAAIGSAGTVPVTGAPFQFRSGN